MIGKILLGLIVFTSTFIFPGTTLAQDGSCAECFITVVNPVRISTYTENIEENLRTQYGVVNDKDLPATWLLDYKALENAAVVDFFMQIDKSHELGLFLEVTPELAEASAVQYNNTGYWYHATSVFFSGYREEDRKKMADALFEKFKETFGFYPKSVGSWWTDSYTLAYVKEKYGIIANLGLTDQFSTDGYQVWGSYWSTPFYPSIYHAGIPAADESVKLDVVTIQWAPRDPYNGYYSSLYSAQDYKVSPLNEETSYFAKLLNLYALKNQNEFGHITVGLESDLSPEAYSGEFAKQMQVVASFKESGVQVVTMSEFAEWYKGKFVKLSPSHSIISNDLTGKPVTAIWYQSPRYRIGIFYDKEKKALKIADLRAYYKDFSEPYFYSPNKEFDLSIYIPSFIDEANYSKDVLVIENVDAIEPVQEGSLLKLNLGSERLIKLSTDGIYFSKGLVKLPDSILRSSVINIDNSKDGVYLTPTEKWLVKADGFKFRDLTLVGEGQLNRWRNRLIIVFSTLCIIFLSLYLIKSETSRKLLFLSLILLPSIVFAIVWFVRNSEVFYVSPGEIDALTRLSVLPEGSVLVYDKICWGCEWNSPEKPAVYDNRRSYVKTLAKKPIVQNQKVVDAKSQEEARLELTKTEAKYIYLAKYENYIEKIPFSPGDLNIEKLYDTANAEVWRVIE